MIKRDILRFASVLAVLVAGSCASDKDSQIGDFQDGTANHPITVEPSFRTLKLAYAGTLSPDDASGLSAFVEDYLAHGNGAISVTAPSGPNSQHALIALGEEIVNLGVPRSRILVGTKDAADSDGRVEFGYISYEARADDCGDWSDDVAKTFDNKPMKNFGCSVQHNIAAQVADPRDLAESRTLEASDTTRRMQVLKNYEQATQTSAQKTKDQSGSVSDVANNGQ